MSNNLERRLARLETVTTTRQQVFIREVAMAPVVSAACRMRSALLQRRPDGRALRQELSPEGHFISSERELPKFPVLTAEDGGLRLRQ